MLVPRRGSVNYDAAQDAFAALEQHISEEWNAVNLMDLLIHINTLIELVEEKVRKMEKRLQ